MDDEDLLLPQTPVARRCYALLQEHFAYPQKQLFSS
jgi:type VI protein secretion system component VasA